MQANLEIEILVISDTRTSMNYKAPIGAEKGPHTKRGRGLYNFADDTVTAGSRSGSSGRVIALHHHRSRLGTSGGGGRGVKGSLAIRPRRRNDLSHANVATVAACLSAQLAHKVGRKTKNKR